ncbi:hypothetical protein ES703_120561 [subsurface metagenome]
MVLYVEVLEGILRRHCCLLQLVRSVCKEWKLESPVTEKDVKVAQANLMAARSLAEVGVSELDLSEIAGRLGRLKKER